MAKGKVEIKFEISNELGVISEGSKGWNLEFNRIMWNGNDPKYDIRTWELDHVRMGRGVTLTEDELRRLKELIDKEIQYLDEN